MSTRLLPRPMRLILCGIDFRVWSELACAGAAELARHFGVRLLVAHVVEDRGAIEQAEGRLREYAREWLGDLPASTAVTLGDPARELARLARREGADLIVIGKRHNPEPLVPVTVEAGLAETAACPVLALGGPEDARGVIEHIEHPLPIDLRCMVCGRLVDDRVCPGCREKITWEAMEHKWHEQLREGPGLMGLGGSQAVGPVLLAAAVTSSSGAPGPRPTGETARRWGVVVFGGASRDYVVRGPRLPRPGEDVEGDTFLEAIGGRGVNQAVAAARLGAKVALGGRVGADEPGRQVLEVLAREEVDGGLLVQDHAAPTGVALILVDERGAKLSGSAPGANRRATIAQAEALAEPLASADVFLTQLELALAAVVRAVEIAARQGVKVVLDAGPPSPAPDALLAAVDLVRANAIEAEVLTGVAVHDRSSARGAGERLLRRGAKAAVIAAPGGNLLVTARGEQWVQDFRVATVDTAGAGDAFAAALAVGLAEGRPLEDTVRFAAAAAALATTRLGALAGLPRRADVLALLARQVA